MNVKSAAPCCIVAAICNCLLTPAVIVCTLGSMLQRADVAQDAACGETVLHQREAFTGVPPMPRHSCEWSSHFCYFLFFCLF